MKNENVEKAPAIDLCEDNQGAHALFHFDDIRISMVSRSENGLVIYGGFDPVLIETDRLLAKKSIEIFPVSRATMSIGQAYEIAISR